MIKKILLPTDGSEYSQKTVQYAIDLARSLGASVDVMHAYQSASFLRKRAAAMMEEYKQMMEEDAKEIVTEIAEQLKSEGIQVSAVVVEGPAAEAILRAVDELNPDVIVMGSRGVGGFSNMLLGGVAEHVVHYSKVPVLVVK
ncbi:MAG: universal stress protein [Anaerolineales bacterium]|nr:universal stress protein [Anaerolineales bacterium]